MKFFTQLDCRFAGNAEVAAAARAAGYAYGPVLHGGKAKPDGKFPEGVLHFFSDSSRIAAEFASYGDGTVVRAYLKMDRPIVYDLAHMDLGQREAYYSEVKDFDPAHARPSDVSDPMGWFDATDRSGFLDAHPEFDGMVVLDKPSMGNLYVVRHSSQIKSADATTYDDQGNPIPLEKRFDSSNPDIRY